MSRVRLTPSLFDKLAAESDVGGLATAADVPTVAREQFRNFAIPDLERFTEASLRATVRRDLAWLLSTVALESAVDMSRHSHVRDSVINFGVREFAGRAHNRRAILAQARDIREAIIRFEPRLDPSSLRVEPVTDDSNPGKIGFTIDADLIGAADHIPIRFRTAIDLETSAVEITD